MFRFTLKQLEVFVALVEHKNFTKAGRFLNMTQPAVSMQLKRLEEQANLKLVNSSGNKVSITNEGINVYEKIHSFYSEIEELSDYFNNVRPNNIGNLTIGVSATYIDFLLDFVKRFNEQYPNINIAVKVANKEALYQLLDDNFVDFILTGNVLHNNLNSTLIMEWDANIVANKDHPLAKQKSIDVECLAKEKIILGDKDGDLTKIFKETVNNKKTHFVYVDNAEAIIKAVKKNIGISILATSPFLTSQTMLEENIVFLDVKTFPRKVKLNFVYKKLSTTAKNFCTMLVNT